uniref:Uncharacterized protein n=1 Tax=Ascaris lumbricoides TaxID=6252 RepID=A0A0M3IR38_ASCLU
MQLVLVNVSYTKHCSRPRSVATFKASLLFMRISAIRI